MVVDTSVLLAVLFDEPDAGWAAAQLTEHASELRMSTVNLAETLLLIRDRQPRDADEIETQITTSGIRFVAPDTQQARIAAQARLRFPLNLGDCFAYALAVAEDCAILTLDRDFRSVDRPVLLPR
ncbi:MAG TPA: type II toxin-antitoxin system VapC family toxin [Candidatus Binatia bacterium]|jgi:ribonuclease VapC|nr:type II toxin-antitoxin system VapC family toxin [Candidatus Binatia bacterium]